MLYDFSQYFKDNNEFLLDEFIDKYTSHFNTEEDETSVLTTHYKNIFNTLAAPFELNDILEIFENLAKHETFLEQPYVIMINEIYGLKSMLINRMTTSEFNKDTNSSIFEFLSLFKNINNKVAEIYLHKYITKLLTVNNIRINSISDLIDRNIIKHYESHLIWLTSLARSIEDKNIDNYPELDDKKCDFGKWLHGDAKHVVQNNSKLKAIDSLHHNLHLFGQKIQKHLKKNEYHILITYLEKCEFLSLSIGTEIALVDNILMNKKVTKDHLTGALNRNGLESVFESQYELSLATNNSFVLAMCDLDYFKGVNDTYGHIAGDKMLKLFVDTAKKHIRNSDVIIRYGGEEFVIMLPAINKEKGCDVLEKIRLEFEKSFLLFEGREIRTTVSIGIIEVKPENYYKQIFVNEYINIADQKLYLAKKGGRNRVEVC
ncbi:diguanylate cyclase [Sulfurimonas sp.]